MKTILLFAYKHRTTINTIISSACALVCALFAGCKFAMTDFGVKDFEIDINPSMESAK